MQRNQQLGQKPENPAAPFAGPEMGQIRSKASKGTGKVLKPPEEIDIVWHPPR